MDREHYTTNDFTALNLAIDTESTRHRELLALYKSKSNLNRAQTFLYVCGAIAVLMLTAGLLYWLFGYNSNGFISTGNLKSEVQSSNLKELSSTSSITDDNAMYTHSIYTVFHRTVTENGETFVTGQEYAGSNLDSPEQQYCYLELLAGGGVRSVNVASVNEAGELTFETDDPELIQSTEQYCNFLKSP
ncbi:hypothetical protein KOI40_13100 [Aestuariicella sp. G3-2]|uniref:hypothetical protein n=1 Tax=Pseudomaricurvus albidus TaxID=2842452 RepID=UPI001C0E1115|nr:hypothetical protein [Aestuariicella albida]MBU3070762.1 hypothetical protein [Aestuariicella albida]